MTEERTTEELKTEELKTEKPKTEEPTTAGEAQEPAASPALPDHPRRRRPAACCPA
jgi:hypothetical protein